MTLDPIHVENIAQLAYGIGGDVDATDHDDLAERVWREWLPELRRDGRVVIAALGDHERRRAAIDDVALAARPFETVHGLDSGTINPTTFKNGLVVDVAHAAMASSPTDLDLHRDRTIVATVHAGDSTAGFDSEWTRRDEGHTKQRVLHVPRVNRYAERVVHALALYLAEGTHALDHADRVDDLLVLDGPVYPKELFTWADRDPELGALAREEFRGAHWREGFQERDDENWLKHTMLSWNGGQPEIWYRLVLLEGADKRYVHKIRSY